MRSCWVLSGMISVSIRLAWLKALHYSIIIVTTFHCCVCCCCYCYYFLCFVVSQHQVCLTCFHAGIWEHVPKDAIIAGESSHPWKYSSCKLKCYSLVILHVVHIFLSIKKKVILHVVCFTEKFPLLHLLQYIFHFMWCKEWDVEVFQWHHTWIDKGMK